MEVTLTTTLEKFDSRLWTYHLPIPIAIAEKYIDGNNRRIKCTFIDHSTIQTALMPSTDYWFIMVNVTLRNKLNLSVGDEVTISIEKDHTEYGMEIPESFIVLMDQDAEGKAHFDNLTPGKKRTLIYLVANVKNIDSQLRKGMAILDHLKEANGKLDFKLINQKIKEYNRLRK